MVAPTPIPHISISPAPIEEPAVEPFSPFKFSFDSPSFDDYRPKHLTPPPIDVHFRRQMSPLRPSDHPAPSPSKGLEPERFEALLRASRERNAAAAKKTDLRKEIALKVHKNKQVERRALFLSKVLAPPSPTATFTPKTPPTSPAIYHWTLPSPGLVSPLALFESLNTNATSGPFSYAREPWVEQVDFRRPNSSQPVVAKQTTVGSVKSIKAIPSLDQISARLGSQGRHQRSRSSETAERTSRLPAFLARPRPSSADGDRPRLPLGIGRLQAPVKEPKAEHLTIMPPASPSSPLSPKIEVTSLLVPRTSSLSPTKLSESNLLALNSRERRAQDMLSTLRRRMLPSEQGLNGHDTEDIDEKKSRRHSAPADLNPHRPRKGFEHPVLSLPGGF